MLRYTKYKIVVQQNSNSQCLNSNMFIFIKNKHTKTLKMLMKEIPCMHIKKKSYFSICDIMYYCNDCFKIKYCFLQPAMQYKVD